MQITALFRVVSCSQLYLHLVFSVILTYSQPMVTNMLMSALTRPKTICGGGQIVFVLAGTASASTHVPAQMAICAGGRLPANTDGAVLAGGLSSRHHRWVLRWRVNNDVRQHSSLYAEKKAYTARRSPHRRSSAPSESDRIRQLRE